MSVTKRFTPWMLLPVLCAASVSSRATDMLYAVSHPWTGQPDTACTEILGCDPATRARRVLYSDRGQLINLWVDNGERVVAAVGAGRLYACAYARPAMGAGCMGNPDHGSVPAIHELSLGGTHRARRIFAPGGDQLAVC